MTTVSFCTSLARFIVNRSKCKTFENDSYIQVNGRKAVSNTNPPTLIFFYPKKLMHIFEPNQSKQFQKFIYLDLFTCIHCINAFSMYPSISSNKFIKCLRKTFIHRQNQRYYLQLNSLHTVYGNISY